jgi:hypothetical protein
MGRVNMTAIDPIRLAAALLLARGAGAPPPPPRPPSDARIEDLDGHPGGANTRRVESLRWDCPAGRDLPRADPHSLTKGFAHDMV